MNKVILVGTLSDPPELKSGDGWKNCKFTVHTKETFIKKDGSHGERKGWHKCVAWNMLADKIHSSSSVGFLVTVQGRIENRKYEDKDGNTRYITEINASDFEVVSPTANSQPANDSPQPAPTHRFDDAVLPF